VRALLPPGLEPDLWDGSAWVAIVAFVMRRTRALRGPRLRLPPIPELNVRTYVRVGGVPAVWFLSLDASSPLFVGVGRSLYGMNYHLSHMTTIVDGERVHYASTRTDAAFAASYGARGEVARVERGSLEHFLVERYRLYALRRGRLIRAPVGGGTHRVEPDGAARDRPRRAAARPFLPRRGRARLGAVARDRSFVYAAQSSRDERRFEMRESAACRASGRAR
jgi:uncharacterized protein YqjF (DUF2071 family)